MFHHPAWAVDSYSSGPQPRELPKSKSTQPRFAKRWATLYDDYLYYHGWKLRRFFSDSPNLHLRISNYIITNCLNSSKVLRVAKSLNIVKLLESACALLNPATSEEWLCLYNTSRELR